MLSLALALCSSFPDFVAYAALALWLRKASIAHLRIMLVMLTGLFDTVCQHSCLILDRIAGAAWHIRYSRLTILLHAFRSHLSYYLAYWIWQPNLNVIDCFQIASFVLPGLLNMAG